MSISAFTGSTRVLLAALCVAGASSASALEPTAGSSRPASQLLSGLPLAFEANRGQAEIRAKFLSRAGGGTLYFSPAEVTIQTARRPDSTLRTGRNTSMCGARPTVSRAQESTLRMVLSGANAKAQPALMHEITARASYFIGSDPRQWRSNVPMYDRVGFRDVYPGIDIIYYGNHRDLEYDFVLAPRADPRSIALAFPGSDDVRIGGAGELQIRTGRASTRWLRPVAYQWIGGKRTPVPAKYVLRSGRRVGFCVARYDRRYPLTIDPIDQFGMYLGGSGLDAGRGIAFENGAVYITGETTSIDFPNAAGGLQPTNQGGQDVFVLKLDESGQNLIYATYLGGPGYQGSGGIAVRDGFAYVTGVTAPGFPVTQNAFQTAPAASNAFVTKLSRDGSALLYSTYLNGNGGNFGTGIAVDRSANAYVCGSTSSTNFVTRGAAQPQFGGGPAEDAFLVRIDTSRSGDASLIYSTYLGGSNGDYGNGVAADNHGNAYVVGYTTSGSGPGGFPHQVSGLRNPLSSQSAFMDKVNTNLSGRDSLVYSTLFGGSSYTSGEGIAVDTLENAYITGQTSATDLPVSANAAQRQYGGGAHDAFVAKINTLATGDAALVYSTYLGDSGDEDGRAIAVDGWGTVTFAGSTSNAAQTDYNGFVDHLNSDGSLSYELTILGGSGNDFVNGVALNLTGDAYATGQTSSSDLYRKYQSNVRDPIPGQYGGGASDAFLFLLRPAGQRSFPLPSSTLLFQDNTSGELRFMLMLGNISGDGNFTDPSVPGSLAWKLAAWVGLSGHVEPDFLFQNQETGQLAYWEMNGFAMVRYGFLNPSNPGSPDWKVVGAADFDGDGKTDLLFQNDKTGQLVYWRMNGTDLISYGFISPSNPGSPDWKVVGMLDLDGDGHKDILFQNRVTNELVYWLMNGPNLVQYGYLNPATNGDTNWKVVGIDDLNNDGYSDLIWQNQTDGRLAYWLMNGPDLVQWDYYALNIPGNPALKLVFPH